MKEFIFVYNANSGIANALVDYGKKYVMPDEYDCDLCMVTYGPFGMKRDWKQFITSLDRPVRFLHKDEFSSEFPDTDVDFPVLVCRENTGAPEVCIDREAFSSLDTLDKLKTAVTQAIDKQ